MVVWVSGASSGLGLNTAAALEKSGMTVVLGARSFPKEGAFCQRGLKLHLDVKDEQSVAAFSAAALEAYGAPDALVCCAGVLTMGACEELTKDEITDVLETNFLGQVAMIQAVLPLMRLKGAGRIVLFSSINGVLGVPFQGAYVASKHALEGYAECLRMEVAPYHIDVCVVEPGDHQSGAQQYRRHAENALPSSPYHAAFVRATGIIARDEANGSDPKRLGARVCAALIKRRLPRKLLIASFSQRLAVVLHRILPVWLFERIIAAHYR